MKENDKRRKKKTHTRTVICFTHSDYFQRENKLEKMTIAALVLVLFYFLLFFFL